MTHSGKAALAVASDTELVITRVFEVPRHLVYRAWTTPELIERWWSGLRGTVTSVEVDLRVGGRWRYVMKANAGFEVAFHGEYREIAPNERIVSTEVFEGAPDAEANATVNTTTFEEADGLTTLTTVVVCPSREVRNAILDSGMEDGMQEAMDALERVAQGG
jgi:uncharacterized protein YndB with AHSA1/START domain